MTALKLYEMEVDAVTYWVAAPDSEAAMVLALNCAAESGDAPDPGLFDIVELTEATAQGHTYHGENGAEEPVPMWDEFLAAKVARVIACSEY